MSAPLSSHGDRVAPAGQRGLGCVAALFCGDGPCIPSRVNYFAAMQYASLTRRKNNKRSPFIVERIRLLSCCLRWSNYRVPESMALFRTPLLLCVSAALRAARRTARNEQGADCVSVPCLPLFLPILGSSASARRAHQQAWENLVRRCSRRESIRRVLCCTAQRFQVPYRPSRTLQDR